MDVATPSAIRLKNALPSQAQELLSVERRERERVDRERASLEEKEAALESELAAAYKREEESVAKAGMETLQEFKQRDLTDLLKKESLETAKQSESVGAAATAGLNKAAQSLVHTALSHDLLSHL